MAKRTSLTAAPASRREIDRFIADNSGSSFGMPPSEQTKLAQRIPPSKRNRREKMLIASAAS